MKLRSHDPIYRAKINLVDLGGKTLPGPYPAAAWVIGALATFVALIILSPLLGGIGIMPIFLAICAGFGVLKWVARETGGDHRLQDLTLTFRAEARSIRRRRQARRTQPVHRSTLTRRR